MIDLHAHILPGLDDGPLTLTESVEMCRRSYQDGIRTIVATPHILEGVYANDRPTILAKVQELNQAINRFGLQSSKFGVKNHNSTIRNPQSEFKVLPGADVHFSFDMLQLCENGEIMTVNDNGRYLMVEFDFQGIPYHAEDVLFQMIMKGFNPIITHPERNLGIGQKPHRYGEMIRMGCLGQATAMSLAGGFGAGVRRTAEGLLRNRLIHIIASDSHSIDRRPPILSTGVRAAEKIVGKEEAQKMVTEYPQAVLDGRIPDVSEPLSP